MACWLMILSTNAHKSFLHLFAYPVTLMYSFICAILTMINTSVNFLSSTSSLDTSLTIYLYLINLCNCNKIRFISSFSDYYAYYVY